ASTPPARRWRRPTPASTTSPSRAGSGRRRTCASTSAARYARRRPRIAARSRAEYARAMEYREPHPSLRGDFERYVGFEDRSGIPRSWLEVPFAGAALIVSLDTRWRMNGAFERGSFIAGVHDEWTV